MANRSSRTVSARRAKLVEQRARRNVIIAFILAIVLMGIFLFVIMPVVFEVAINFARHNGSGTNILSSDTIPPQRPAFQPPEEFTNETTLKLQGFTEPQAKVLLEIDGETVQETNASEDGAFTLEHQLQEGEFQVQVKAMDEATNESSSDLYPVTIDTTKPTLAIDSPENNATYTLRSEKVLKILGTASEPGTVYVNGSLVFTDDEGTFTSSLSLGDDENEIEIIAEDQAGNRSDSTQLTVFYRP